HRPGIEHRQAPRAGSRRQRPGVQPAWGWQQVHRPSAPGRKPGRAGGVEPASPILQVLLANCLPRHYLALHHNFRMGGVQSMKGDPQVIDALNGALTIELTAINQYFCQAKMNQNWGFLHLYKKHYEESLGEMKHAEKLIERILFLEGVPEIARYDVIRV